MAAGHPVEERSPAATVRLRTPRSLHPALELFLWSRAAVWLAAVFAFVWFEPNRHPLADRWDSERLHDLGYGIDIWARWDSAWFLRIAEEGYSSVSTAAFYPLYPGAVAAVGRIFLGHYVLAGVAVSLAACLGAFLLFHRLAEAKLGAEGARRAVLYLAVFPMTLFLQAVYSESLYLVLAVATFLLAERGRFLPASAAAGLALLVRGPAVALLPALAVFAWRARERRRALASLLAAPAVFATYPLVLLGFTGDSWRFVGAQEDWGRYVSRAGPLGGIWAGLEAAWRGMGELVTGSDRATFGDGGHLSRHVAAESVETFAFLLLFLVLTAVAWRRFGTPYGLFCAISLAIPLSVPSERFPLLSLPRFGVVVFPFFLALAALAAGRPRLHAAIVSVSAVLLGITVVQWALWQWVA